MAGVGDSPLPLELIGGVQLGEQQLTIKFLQRLYGLPSLAARNHLFDTSTPTGSNYQTRGAPAPPRDARTDISDLFDLFSF